MKKTLSGIVLALFLLGSTPSFAFATTATSSDISSLLSQISALMRQIEELKTQARSLQQTTKSESRDDDDRKEKKRSILVRCDQGDGVFPMKWNTSNGKGKHKGEWKKFYRYCKKVNNGTSTDSVAPSITSIAVSNITSSGATITWTTDENANSVVAYGTTSAYGATSTSLTFKKNHSITLTGLSASTLYNFQVRSADLAGNLVVSSNVTLWLQ
jgi:hypothetical protein